MNLAFEKVLVPVIKKRTKPNRLTKNSASAIDHIITNSPLHRTITAGIIKPDASDYFPIFLIAETESRIIPVGKYKLRNELRNQ